MGPRSMKTYGPNLRAIIADAAEAHAKLTSYEVPWRNKQLFLQSRGYMLRPRYHPDWVPSWTLPENADIDPETFEDYIALPTPFGLIDGTRIADGTKVFIKRVSAQGDEARIARFLHSEKLADDPRNHCVPVLDFLVDDEDPSLAYLIMPLLRFVDKPPFETPDNVIDFVDQMLEGLVFMHEHGVAHRDCSYKNIMMDANALFPKGFHPAEYWLDASADEFVEPLSRSLAPVKYYFVDFGISVHILPGQPSLALGGHGLDRSAPELSFRIPYDPFKLDIYILGNMFRTLIYNKYDSVPFLQLLIDTMTRTDPALRPSALEAKKLWQSLRRSVTPAQRTWRLRFRNEYMIQRVIRDGAILLEQGLRMACRFIGIADK